MRNNRVSLNAALIVAFALLLAAQSLSGAAAVTIVNGNAPGVGFNDTTPAVPVGGNTGMTLGQQRLIAFQHAATIWGSTLDSRAEIRILATFEPLSCNATSAVLGSAGTIYIFANYPQTGLHPGPEFPDTWYSSALADKRAGLDLDPTQPDIRARFNVNLGNVGCLTGVGWYLGLDNNHSTQIDLVAVLLHEFGHGLGFQQFASLTSGSMIFGFPDVYNRQLLDTTSNKTWDQMTNAERVASAINSRRVVWTGATVKNDVPGVLSYGTPLLRINGPQSIVGTYDVGTAAFGPALSSPGITGNVVQALDPADAAGPSTTDGCSPLTNAGQVAGNIAIIDRGTCGFVVKVKNAQNAGAIAVIIADNAAGSPPARLGGTDPTIVIPAVRVTLTDGNTIKTQLASGVNATLGLDMTVLAGADAQGRALMNAPNPVQTGSSISHWDPIASRNQLMEPSIEADLTHSVAPPEDLTLPLMRDIGWFPDFDVDGLADNLDQCPKSDTSPTVVINSCQTGAGNTLFTSGCTISDELQKCSVDAKNHGEYVSCVSQKTNTLRKNGVITGEEKDAIQSCAGSAGKP